MMGAHHAACGAAAWIAVTTRVDLHAGPHLPVLPETVTLGLGLLEVSPVGVVTGALVTAGAALLPDADHRSATIAHSLPPLSNVFCSAVGAVSGGHRKGTHSLLGVIAFVGCAFVAGLWTVETQQFGTVYPGAGLLTVLLVSFAAKALKIIPDNLRKSPWAVGLTAGAFITAFAPEEQFWFPLAVGIGVVVHILGDLLTTGGCNPVYPLRIRRPRRLAGVPILAQVWRPNGNLALPLLGNAGSLREWCLLVPVSLYAVGGLAWAVARFDDGGGALLRAAGLP
ncbi:metal-dependent hydrolase [Arthrobacter agilis]|uniref:metal-dependent hydrolase n=1 Tax=Arthrobacter agilis TaxID=37921 RepID=UPI000B35668A|nr:metal-dependent hydrolase [Arthrobacter agilis]OUM43576.1 hydrolase [Arthrobacter agilis]PPB47650.1 hydrolase [Arthrobacter agilis]TPV24823.1 metal-dependent hydrolase [Arthrobacter agilis]VDR30967.1 inner membrane protein [Arthrobacter agilis]